MSIEIPGIIEHVIYPKNASDSKGGFAIFAVSLNNLSSKYNKDINRDVLVKLNSKNYKSYGTFAVTVNNFESHVKYVGGQYVFIGEYNVHPKFGPQFKSDFFYQDTPSNEEGLKSYLMTLPNVKGVRSRSIIKKFGYKGTIEILDNEPMRLTEINGITARMIPDIKTVWDEGKTRRILYEFLGEHKISPSIGSKAFDQWKEEALDIIKSNPYKLAELKGVGFETADIVAHQVFNYKVPVEYRVSSCIEYILTKDVFSNSNLCIPYSSLRTELNETLVACNNKLGLNKNEFIETSLINKCIRSNLERITAVKDIEGETGKNVFVYLRRVWESEKFISEGLYSRNSRKSIEYSCSETDLSDAESDIRRFMGISIVLDDCQKEAVKSAFKNNVTVITGGGGTGKSTICRCIYYLSQKKKLPIRMMSPTGRAAQVLSNKTGYAAHTIHRSLKFTPDDNYPHDVITESILIVDEVSMVGVDTMFAIMYALTKNEDCHIVFVGDSNQLPSVSPGNFLSDIMKNKIANVVRLTQIHRQDEKSYISLIANEISNGVSSEIPLDASDMKWVDVEPDNFSMVFCNAIHKYMQDNRVEDLQVISPKYKGKCGVDTCNQLMQQIMVAFNGESECLERKFITFYVGDRVIQTENNYEKMIFNGDIGIIRELGTKVIDPSKSDKEEDFIIADFYGDEKVFIGNEIDSLNLAWCITVHKFQGSQSPNIMFIMSSEAHMMMSKELVYTAFTRAEKYITIFGSKHCLKMAPHSSVIRKRFTNVDKLVKQASQKKKILISLKSDNGVKNQCSN